MLLHKICVVFFILFPKFFQEFLVCILATLLEDLLIFIFGFINLHWLTWKLKIFIIVILIVLLSDKNKWRTSLFL